MKKYNAAVHGILTLIGSSYAFVPPSASVRSVAQCSFSFTLPMSSTSTSSFQPTQSSLDKLESLKLSIKKPRGASIGVECSQLDKELSDGDLKILSMQLRRSAKAAAIWSSDVESIEKLVKEQESARGDFPGPLPVIYSGSITDVTVVKTVVEGGVTAIVADYKDYMKKVQPF